MSDASNWTVELNGVEPSTDMMSFLKGKLNQLVEYCPSSSHLHISLSQRDGLYMGALTLYDFGCSTPLQFESESLPNLLMLLLQAAEEDLLLWRHRRFSEAS